MKINHEQTKIKLLEITELIKKQNDALNVFNTSKKETLSNEMWAEKAKTDKVNELWNTYMNGLSETKTTILERLETIRELEKANEQILELDVPEFANTLAVCKSGLLPFDCLENVLKQFAGQRQILLILQRCFSDETYASEFDKYTVDIDSAVESLIFSVRTLEQSNPYNAAINLQQMFDDIISFGECHGVKFSESERTSGMENKIEDLENSDMEQYIQMRNEMKGL